MTPFRAVAAILLAGPLLVGCAVTGGDPVARTDAAAAPAEADGFDETVPIDVTTAPATSAEPDANPVGIDPGSEKDRLKKAAWARAVAGLRFEADRVVVETAQAIPDADLAAAHRAAGDARMAANRPTDAVEAYRNALEADAADAVLYDRLGRAMIARGKVDLARASFATAAALAPDDPAPRVALAETYGRDGRFDEAIAAMHAALELDPDLGVAHRRLAVWQYYAGNDELAWEHLRRAEALGAPVPSQLADLLRRRRAG